MLEQFFISPWQRDDATKSVESIPTGKLQRSFNRSHLKLNVRVDHVIALAVLRLYTYCVNGSLFEASGINA